MLAIGKQFKLHKDAQRGINMVDLMMWLVIAALMMAAAIQSILYYQQATYVYHAKSDLAGAHQWVLSDTALNSKVPKAADMEQGLANGDLSLTTVGDQTNIGLIASTGNKYCVGVKSATVNDLSRNVFYLTSDDPNTIVRGTSIPESCGKTEAFAPGGTDTSGAVAPAQAPVVTGEAVATTTAEFYWDAVPGASSYRVEKKINDDGWSVEEANYTDLGILIDANSGDSITLRVTAINDSGESLPSAPVTVILPASTPTAFAGWGRNNTAQINDGTFADAISPVKVEGSGALATKQIDYIRSGRDFSCALAEAKVYCWGAAGLLGNGTSDASVLPVEVNLSAVGSRTVTALTVGERHSCLIASGEVFCWGENYRGKAGGSSSSVLQPTLVSGELTGKTVSSVVAGDGNTCAVANGGAYCWGDNSGSEIKNGAGDGVLSPISVDTSGVLNGVTITEVAPAANYTCVTGNSKVYCWGSVFGFGNTPAEFDPTGLMSGKTVTSLKSGTSHSCAIAGGVVYCWGASPHDVLGTDTVTAPHTTVAVTTPYGTFDKRSADSLSVGGANSCAVMEGKAYCWGWDINGAVGNGSSTLGTHIPAPVDMTTALNGKTVMSVSVGWQSTFAGYNDTPTSSSIRPNFSAPQRFSAGWGYNPSGTLGNGNTTDALTPQATPNTGSLEGKKVSQVNAGSGHSCAIAEGAVHCWGTNLYGQLGVGDVTNTTVPVPVYADGWFRTRAVTQVSTHGSNSCAIAEERLYCWGWNGHYHLGESVSKWTAPAPVKGALADKRITHVDVGSQNVCAIADGKAYCWGSNDWGQLGMVDNSVSSATTPTLVNDTGVLKDKTVTAIQTNHKHTCAIADGKAYCWGANDFGQLGVDNGQNSRNSPLAVDQSGVIAGKTLKDITIVHASSCALDTDGKAYCWGLGGTGELGAGSWPTWTRTPTAVAMDGKSFTKIVSGDSHTCALTTTNKVNCWGNNDRGHLGTGDTSKRDVPTEPNTSGILSGVAVQDVWAGVNSTFVGY